MDAHRFAAPPTSPSGSTTGSSRAVSTSPCPCLKTSSKPWDRQRDLALALTRVPVPIRQIDIQQCLRLRRCVHGHMTLVACGIAGACLTRSTTVALCGYEGPTATKEGVLRVHFDVSCNNRVGALLLFGHAAMHLRGRRNFLSQLTVDDRPACIARLANQLYLHARCMISKPETLSGLPHRHTRFSIFSQESRTLRITKCFLLQYSLNLVCAPTCYIVYSIARR